MINHMHKQKGAVSIFVVVFSAIFVTIITVSFVSLMIRAQQQATNADLSNSAYDSALAGVEDAKRLLLKYRQCLKDNSSHTDCASVIDLFNNQSCNMVRKGLTGDSAEVETLIKSETESASTGNSQLLDQAYTCVEIDYMGPYKELQLEDGVSNLVPLDSSGQQFDSVTISWFVKTAASAPFTLPDPGVSGGDLPMRGDWGIGSPPILRTQIIQYGDSFTVSGFDADQAGEANTRTSFLYPFAGSSTPTNLNVNDFDYRPVTDPGTKSPVPVVCRQDRFMDGQYACIANIQLPTPIGGGTSRSMYLNLQPLYNDTKVKIELKKGSDPVEIVAPTIDATGRANDLFRRVKVGVSFNGIYPKTGFDITGNLCKDFSVTADSYDQGRCNPNNP